MYSAKVEVVGPSKNEKQAYAGMEKANSYTWREPTLAQLNVRNTLRLRKPKRQDIAIYKERILTTGKHEIRNTVESENNRYKTKRARLLRESMQRLPVFKSHNYDKCGRIEVLPLRAYLTRIIKNNWKSFKNRKNLSKEDKLYLERLKAILELRD